MFSDTKFWRLVWKEYRTQRPLWLALLIAAPVMQVAWLVLMWFTEGPRFQLKSPDMVRGFYAIGFVTSAIYLLGCCATMFSVEHETGTFDFQRVLPTNQPRVFWAKIGFAVVSVLLLTALLWFMTHAFFVRFASIEPSWLGADGVLYMAELFVWSLLASLLIRQPLWAVIIAVSLQSLMMQLALPYLTTGKHGFEILAAAAEDLWFLAARIVVLVLIAAVDIVLGKLWYEDRLWLPRWRFRLKPDMAPSYPAEGELLPYRGQRQIGWSRLLWLGWRDARWMISGVLAWYVFCWTPSPTPSQLRVLLLSCSIGSFVCGLFAFASEQWGCRFRFTTERGCSPRFVWLSRQVTWLPAVVIMTLGGYLIFLNSRQLFNSAPGPSQIVLVMPFVCYSAAQFAAMLCRSTVMAMAIGLLLTVLGIMWSVLMTAWLAPIWWSVGAWPVIGLFVTWLRANDWIEERRDRVARWRFALGLGVPICLLLITCMTYRVIQIPTVTLPAEWDETPQVLARLTPAEKETLAVYRRALAEIERGEDQLETYEGRKTRLKQEHADWTDNQVLAEAFTGFYRDWLTQHVAAVPLLREAHRMPPVPLALIEAGLPDRPNDDSAAERTEKLPWLMIQQAEHSLEDGDLDATWNDILISFELLRRSDLRAGQVLDLGVDASSSMVHEACLLETVANWGRHKEQTRDHILMAIRKLDKIAAAHASIQKVLHHDYLQAQEVLKLGKTWQRYARSVQSWSQGETFWWWSTAWKATFWERWRSQRVLRWLSSLAITRAEDLTRLIVANQPLSPTRLRDTGIGWQPVEMNMMHTTLLPPTVANWLSVGNLVINRVESFRATMLLLALADFHREHGRYPESLDELAPTYFAEAPRDPQTAGPFVYFPHGLSEDVTDGAEFRSPVRVIIHKGVPFLSTAGTSDNISTRALPDGTWDYVNHLGKLVPPSEAFKLKRIWRLKNATEESQ